jgi:hypothetical protein
LTDQSDSLLSLKRSKAANIGWGRTPDWPKRTENGRQAANDRFLTMAGGDPKRAAKLRQAHYQNMAEKSVAARRAKAAARRAAAQEVAAGETA